MIIFKKVRWKNFLSTGNQPTEIQLDKNPTTLIIGENGAGKSTVMKIIAGLDKNFQGNVVFSEGYTVGYLAQEPILDETKSVREIVQEGAQETVYLLKIRRY